MFHEMPLKLYFIKYSERKVSQCILALWKSLKLFEEESKITSFPILDAKICKGNDKLSATFSEQILSVVDTLNLVVSEDLNTNLPYRFLINTY